MRIKLTLSIIISMVLIILNGNAMAFELPLNTQDLKTVRWSAADSLPTEAVVVSRKAGSQIPDSPVIFNDNELLINFPAYSSPADIYVAVGNSEGLFFVNSAGDLTTESIPYAMGAEDAVKASVSISDQLSSFKLFGEGMVYWLLTPGNGGDIEASMADGAYEVGQYYITYPGKPLPTQIVTLTPQTQEEIANSPVVLKDNELSLNFPVYNDPADIYVVVGNPAGLFFVNSAGNLTSDTVPYAMGAKEAVKASFSITEALSASEVSGTGEVYWMLAPGNGGDFTASIAAGSYELGYYNVIFTDPFNNGSDKRNLIVVISDMHLGADLTYAECNKNLGPLEKLLINVKESLNVKELVIAGDLIDEWFVPATTDTYAGKDQADFVERLAETNRGVFDALNQIIDGGNILVTYTPGNHDLTVTAENVSKILPGINQARDDVLGLGTYSPEGYPEIAIEHGHRYNIFCAPDPFSNQNVAPGTILPPGYFFTRIAALHVQQGCTESTNTVPEIVPNASADKSQQLMYEYRSIWVTTLNMFPIENPFTDKMIVTNIDGFTGTYSVNDLLPHQPLPKGDVKVALFDGIQDRWAERCERNLVAIPIPADQALKQVMSALETDSMAVTQYFMNPDSDVRLVVFGHTHEAKINAYENYNGQKSVYANSGTWIDNNPNCDNKPNCINKTMDFVVITPQNDDEASQTSVKLYNFKNEIVTEMASESLRF